MNKAEQNKRYKATHAEQIAEYNKNYRANNLDAVKATEKAYRDTHKEEKKMVNKQYYENNKDKITAHKSQKIKCECGGEYTANHKSDHIKTKKHIDKMAEINKPK